MIEIALSRRSIELGHCCGGTPALKCLRSIPRRMVKFQCRAAETGTCGNALINPVAQSQQFRASADPSWSRLAARRRSDDHKFI